MDTQKLQVKAEDGTLVTLVVPTDIPSNDRADVLRSLYDNHVKHEGDGHWKGPCHADVPAELANDVAEAMNFMGSMVDTRHVMPDTKVYLYSKGYWAHGY